GLERLPNGSSLQNANRRESSESALLARMRRLWTLATSHWVQIRFLDIMLSRWPKKSSIKRDIANIMPSPAQTDIQLIAKSGNRTVLEAVPFHPLTREELANRLPLSESAVGRKLSDFVDRDWVAHPDSGFRITTVGRHVLREYDRCQ